jgi:hypothetical protein
MKTDECKTEPEAALCAAPCSAIYRDMWAVVFPGGHIVTGSDLQTEADAWRVALGWPGPDEIEDTKRRGAFAVNARLRYYAPNAKDE